VHICNIGKQDLMIQDPSSNPLSLGFQAFSWNWRYCSFNPQTSLNI